jgi:hypothetical protein
MSENKDGMCVMFVRHADLPFSSILTSTMYKKLALLFGKDGIEEFCLSVQD